LQQFLQVFAAEVSEGHDTVGVDAVDVHDTVLRLHLDGDLVQPILVHAEHFGDAGDGEDVGDRGHAQAARAASRRLCAQFQGSSSSSRVTRCSLMRASTSAR
jgi:hypothetical protein